MTSKKRYSGIGKSDNVAGPHPRYLVILKWWMIS